MARPLVLSLDGEEFPVNLTKIDRDKLYGSVTVEAFDEDGDEVFLRVLAYDGKTIIDKGGTALATVTEQGDSIPRNRLIAVSSDGEELEPVPSSFSAPNLLQPATVEDYLSHTVKTVYALEAAEEGELDHLRDSLSDGRIYKFPFSYRGGLEYDGAFLIGNTEGIFMIVGQPAVLKFLKLGQAAVLEPAEEQEVAVDDLDFDLL
ncbi:MAG: hypothetical protein IT174_00315 [Acidobacteria bacterium]|nr:hypothetical protein [Acidobacteriota bacterium]